MEGSKPHQLECDGHCRLHPFLPGATIMVPIFIEEGEIIRIDTDERKYLGRDNS